MFHQWTVGHDHDIKTAINPLKIWQSSNIYLEMTLTHQGCMKEEIKCKIKSENSCYHLVQNLFFFP